MRLIRRSRPALDVDELPGTGSALGRTRARSRSGSRGQSLVEFSLIFTPLMLIFMGLAQFGFIFHAYISMANSVREAARIGSIYVYDRSLSKDQNDTARNNAMRTTLVGSFNQLSSSAPQFTSSSTWSHTSGSLVWTTGDVQVTYVIPVGISDYDARPGQQLTIRATYHLTLFIPLVANLLPRDAGGRLQISTESTMVIN